MASLPVEKKNVGDKANGSRSIIQLIKETKYSQHKPQTAGGECDPDVAGGHIKNRIGRDRSGPVR